MGNAQEKNKSNAQHSMDKCYVAVNNHTNLRVVSVHFIQHLQKNFSLMELAIVSHFFPYTFENLSKCALSKALLLKGRKDTDRKKIKNICLF